MVSITSDFFEDRVRFYYSLTKRPGWHIISPEGGCKEIMYDNIDKLKKVPKDRVESIYFSHLKEFFIPKANKTLVFVIHSWQEHSMGPNEEEIYGPFLSKCF